MNNRDSFPAPFCLHKWLVHPDLNRISGPDGPVRVEPRVMAVLLALAAQPNIVVSRLALLDEVWGDTVVGEEILTRAISELRRVFGDNARQPEYIETIPQNGYRLIAPITVPAETEARPEVEPVAAPSRTAGGSWLRLLIVALALLGLGLIGRWVLLSFDRPGGSVTMASAVPLTSYPGREFHPALAPDGTRVAFAWSGPDQGHTAIYIKQRNSETALQLTTAPGWAAWPTWSPDAQTVAFVQTAEAVSTIGLVPGLGGPVRWLHSVKGLIEGLDWSPDGTSLAFAARDSVTGRYRLFLCELADLRVSSVPVGRPDDAGDFQPRFGPDGRRLAWLGRDLAGGSAVFVAPVSGGEARMVTAGLAKMQGLAWTASGQGLIYAASVGGVYRLWTVATAGGPAQLIPTPGDFAWNPTVARRTGDLACEQVRVDQDLWRVAIPDRATWKTERQPFLTSTRSESAPDFRPDGGAIAFVSNRSGQPEVWLATVDGSQPRQLTSLGATAVSNLLWAPGGNKLACAVVLDGASEIVIINAASGVTQRLTAGHQHEVFVGWGATGQDVLLAARAGNAEWQVFRQRLDGGEAIQVTRTGGLMARESGDGRTLYFTRPDRPGLWRRQTGGRVTPELILPDLLPRDRANWCLTDRRLVWVLRTAGRAVLMEYELATGAAEMLAELPGFQGSGLAVLPGQDVFVYPRWGEIAGDLMLLPGAGE